MSSVVRGIIERGMAISDEDYAVAAARRAWLIDEFTQLLDGFDALLTLSATGSAPVASGSTGDPIMATTWTLLGAPAITLPLLTGADRMPIGVQIVGRPTEDGRLLAAAAWLEARHGSRTEMPA
jgi:Asp-tRNA(Asn)/Glu-tRNA(Gln) amidotransferase A subunit family amidase